MYVRKTTQEFVFRHSVFAIRNSPSNIRHSPFGIRHLAFGMCKWHVHLLIQTFAGTYICELLSWKAHCRTLRIRRVAHIKLSWLIIININWNGLRKLSRLWQPFILVYMGGISRWGFPCGLPWGLRG